MHNLSYYFFFSGSVWDSSSSPSGATLSSSLIVASQCHFCFQQLQLCQRKSCCLPSLIFAVQLRDPWSQLSLIRALHYNTSLQARRSEITLCGTSKQRHYYKAHRTLSSFSLLQNRPCKAIHPSLLKYQLLTVVFLELLQLSA